jgi:hypothetical protein
MAARQRLDCGPIGLGADGDDLAVAAVDLPASDR